MCGSVDCGFGGPGIPDLGGPIVARRRDPTAVGTERHIRDRSRVPAQYAELLFGRGIPEPDGVIIRGRSDPRAVEVEPDRTDERAMSAQDSELVLRSDVPYPHGFIPATGDEQATVRAVGGIEDFPDVAGENTNPSCRWPNPRA